MFNCGCNVKSIEYDFDNYFGVLFLEGENVPDMSSTIRSFTDIDHECTCIAIVKNGNPLGIYVINYPASNCKWVWKPVNLVN